VRSGSASVSRFVALTFAVTWIGSAVALRGDFGTEAQPVPLLRTLLLVAGTLAPSLVAILLTALEEGGPGVRRLLRRLFHARVAARWYVFAFGYMTVIVIPVFLVGRLVGKSWLSWNPEIGIGLLVTLAITLPIHAGEEIGWRGYALPRLAARFGFARASLVLGLVWACWHIPLYYLPGTESYGQSIPAFTLMVTAISVAMTWLYVNTKGSLLLATLMHWAINHTLDFVATRPPEPENPLAWSRSPEHWLAVGLMWIAAAYFLVKLRQFTAHDQVNE
jgi:membrane protease YdiL (CAAX protease family)